MLNNANIAATTVGIYLPVFRRLQMNITGGIKIERKN